MRFTKTIMAVAAMALAFNANADEGFQITGDFAGSFFIEDGSGQNLGDAHNSFSFDLSEVNLKKEMGNSRIHLAIGYGEILNTFNNPANTTEVIDPDDQTAIGGPNGPVGTVFQSKSSTNLTNAYFAHNFDNGLGMRFGRFQGFLGSEVYQVQNNMNYTFSYGFGSIAPKFHTGLELNYNVADMVDVAFYAVNSAQNTDLDENDNMYYGLSLGYTGMENLTVKLNYLAGRIGNDSTTDSGATVVLGAYDDTTIELMAMYDMDAFTFGFDYIQRAWSDISTGGTDLGSSSIAAYVGYSMDDWGVNLRYEMAQNDEDAGGLIAEGGTTNEANSISAITLSAHTSLDTNMRLMAEVRMDSADEEGTFREEDGTATDSMTQYGLALMYQF